MVRSITIEYEEIKKLYHLLWTTYGRMWETLQEHFPDSELREYTKIEMLRAQKGMRQLEKYLDENDIVPREVKR